MEQLFGKNLKTNDGEEFSFDRLTEVSFIFLYFGASYCPPSQNFLPLLIDFQKEINQGKEQIEIIYFCLDYEESKFKKHIESIPWPYYSFQDSKIKELIQKYQVTEIPKVIVLNKEAKVITKDARRDISLNGEAALRKWLSVGSQVDLNESSSMESMEVQNE